MSSENSSSSESQECILKCEGAKEFYNFPTKTVMRNVWLYKLGLEDDDFYPKPTLCDRHFSEKMFDSNKKLKLIAVPDINLPTEVLSKKGTKDAIITIPPIPPGPKRKKPIKIIEIPSLQPNSSPEKTNSPLVTLNPSSTQSWINDTSDILVDYQLKVRGKHLCDVIEIPECIVVFTVIKAKQTKLIQLSDIKKTSKANAAKRPSLKKLPKPSAYITIEDDTEDPLALSPTMTEQPEFPAVPSKTLEIVQLKLPDSQSVPVETIQPVLPAVQTKTLKIVPLKFPAVQTKPLKNLHSEQPAVQTKVLKKVTFKTPSGQTKVLRKVHFKPRAVQDKDLKNLHSKPPAVQTKPLEIVQTTPPAIETNPIEDQQPTPPEIQTKPLEIVQPTPPEIQTKPLEIVQPTPPVPQPNRLEIIQPTPPGVQSNPIEQPEEIPLKSPPIVKAKRKKEPEIDIVYYTTDEAPPRRDRGIQVDLSNKLRETGIQCDVQLDNDVKEMSYNADLHWMQSPFNTKNSQINMDECLVCGEIFSNYASKVKHAQVHELSPSLCSQCGDIFESRIKLKIHEKAFHSNNLDSCKPQRCPKTNCNKAFRSKKRLYDHIEEHVRTKEHKCNKCLQIFSSSMKLSCHQRALDKCLRNRGWTSRRWSKRT